MQNLLQRLKHFATPSKLALGSCRKKLPSLETNRAEYERIVEVFEAHNIRYFFTMAETIRWIPPTK